MQISRIRLSDKTSRRLSRLQPFCYLHDCSGCFRLERLPGGSYTHWKAPPFHGAHPTRTPEDIFLGNTDPRSGPTLEGAAPIAMLSVNVSPRGGNLKER